MSNQEELIDIQEKLNIDTISKLIKKFADSISKYYGKDAKDIARTVKLALEVDTDDIRKNLPRMLRRQNSSYETPQSKAGKLLETFKESHEQSK